MTVTATIETLVFAAALGFAGCRCQEQEPALDAPPLQIKKQVSSHSTSAADKALKGTGSEPRASVKPPSSDAAIDVPEFRLPADCAEPTVHLATAAAKDGEIPAFTWSLQALYAYEDTVPHAPGEERLAYHLTTRRTNVGGRGQVELWAVCERPLICERLAAIQRRVVPGNQARPVCSKQPSPELRPSPPAFEPAFVRQSVRSSEPEAAAMQCVRWAACSARHDSALDTKRGLECLKAPHKYVRERKCARAPTCFDVAQCLGQSVSGVPEFTLGRLDEQFEERSGYLLELLGNVRFDRSGSGGAEPADLHEYHHFQLEKPSAATQGIWMLAPLSFSGSQAVPDEDPPLFRNWDAEVRLFWLRPAEAPISGPTFHPSGDSYDDRGVSFQTVSGSPLAFDFDGDGFDEVGVYEWSFHHTRDPEQRLRIYTRESDAIAIYAPSAELPVVGVEDVDDDGRPDLLLDLQQQWRCAEGLPESSGCPGTTHTSLHPQAVAHSLPDGTFSREDDVAKDYTPDR